MPRTYAFYKGTKAENPKARTFDRLVTSWPRTKGRFSHSERAIPVSDGTWTGLSSSFRDNGVRAKAIDFMSGRWVLVTIPGPDEIGIAAFNRELGKGYDTIGLFGFVLPVWVQLPWDWFCSELNAHMENLSEPWKWHPNKFFEHLKSIPGAVVIEP